MEIEFEMKTIQETAILLVFFWPPTIVLTSLYSRSVKSPFDCSTPVARRQYIYIYIYIQMASGCGQREKGKRRKKGNKKRGQGKRAIIRVICYPLCVTEKPSNTACHKTRKLGKEVKDSFIEGGGVRGGGGGRGGGIRGEEERNKGVSKGGEERRGLE